MEPAPSTLEPGTDAAPTARYRSRFNEALFAWHAGARRTIAIRSATTPWAVLVGEVMSQQTQIDRIGPAWERWMARWPTPASLAEASAAEVVTAWAGLGYNRRAIALHRAARAIVDEHDGVVPPSVEALEALPGIGPYTARAVAATAFGRAVAPLDVNVRRVVARFAGISADSPELQRAADALVAPRDPRGWVDGVMDLAATVCLRRAPACGACPLQATCRSSFTPGEPPTRRTTAPTRFEATNRWLRGRLLAAVRETPPGTWTPVPERLGEHDSRSVRAAVEALAREGFLDLEDGRARLRAG